MTGKFKDFQTDRGGNEYLQLIGWKDDVDPKHYESAYNYLSLRWNSERATEAVALLKQAPVIERDASDILRAARLDPVPMNDAGVAKELMKVLEGKKLSPILCITMETGLEIADGFHRTSLAYGVHPFDIVRLKLA